ncbi:MAG: hypothetical protein V1738_01885 [Patescibacteria group bacterium]
MSGRPTKPEVGGPPTPPPEDSGLYRQVDLAAVAERRERRENREAFNIDAAEIEARFADLVNRTEDDEENIEQAFKQLQIGAPPSIDSNIRAAELELASLAAEQAMTLAELERTVAEQFQPEETEPHERSWQELRTAGADRKTIRLIADQIADNPAELDRLAAESAHLDPNTVRQIIRRAAEDNLFVLDKLGDGQKFGLSIDDLDELQTNSHDFVDWKLNWNLAVQSIDTADNQTDNDAQLNDLADQLIERPDRLELLLGLTDGKNGPTPLGELSLTQRHTISERLRFHGFADRTDTSAAIDALVLDHPDRFRDIYNTVPVSKEQTERLLLTVPAGPKREQVLRDMELKNEQAKWGRDQIDQLTTKFEHGPELDNRAIIEQLEKSSLKIYDAASRVRPEFGLHFTDQHAGWKFSDLAFRAAHTEGKKMVDVAGLMMSAQKLYEQGLAGERGKLRDEIWMSGHATNRTATEIKAEIEIAEQQWQIELSELNQALAKNNQLVEQARLAAERELAGELEAINLARQELYDAIKEEDPESRDYLESRERIEKKLATEQLIEVQDLGANSGTTAPTRNYFEQSVLPAVGKSAAKELRALPTPETHRYGYSIKAESMTNDVAMAFGLHNVVPSVDRLGPEGVTNFQEWYPGESLDNYPWGNQARRNPNFADKLRDVTELRFLVRDTDGHSGNMKLLNNGDIISIDHGQAFIGDRPDNLKSNIEPYNYFRCYAAWAVGGDGLRPERKQRYQEFMTGKRFEKTRTALWKLFVLRFGDQAENNWLSLQARLEQMIDSGLPHSGNSADSGMQKIDRACYDDVFASDPSAH